MEKISPIRKGQDLEATASGSLVMAAGRGLLRGLRFLLFLTVASVPVSGSLMGFAYLAPSPWQYDLRMVVGSRAWSPGELDLATVASFLLSRHAPAPAADSVEAAPEGDGEAANDAGSPMPQEAVASEVPTPSPDPPPGPPGEAVMVALTMREGGTRLPDSLPAPRLTPTPIPRKEALKPQSYRVVAGDSLVKIAASFGITPETVLWANDLGNGELLQIGQEITILPVSGVLHRVEGGETLRGVAEIYGADVEKLLEANLLSPSDHLQEGQLLVVPGGMQRTLEFPGLPSAPSEQELAAAPKYRVELGDTLVSIADGFGVQPSVIQVANGLLDPDLLEVGQQLSIPGGKPPSNSPRPASPSPSPQAQLPTPTPRPVEPTPVPTAAMPTPAPTGRPSTAAPSYTVKTGDTLFSIARSFGVKPAVVQEANGLADPNALKVGQQLTIPGGSQAAPAGAPQAAAPTATAALPTATAAPPTPAATPQPARPTPTSTPPAGPTAAPQPTKSAPAPAASPQPAPPPPPPASGSRGDQLAAIAQRYLGYRYVWGGHATTGFDCSGFTWYVYKEAGLNIPLHDLAGQLNTGQKVPRDKLLPGDLVFFQNTYKPGLSHSGIYLGGGRFINAESEAVGVQVRAITDPAWSSRFVGASRPW